MIKKRKFSIPFNGTNPDEYLKLAEPFKEYVDNIFLGISFIDNHINYRKIAKYRNIYQNTPEDPVKMADAYDKNCCDFLIKSKGLYKRILTLNCGVYYFDMPVKMFQWLNTVVIPFIEKYNIDGVICTEFNMAKYLHENLPYLELHTSCNCYQWNIKQMEMWQNECGISVFNPPREILRSPSKLKEMHDVGFKLKCIVNEACLFGCPQQMNHCISLAMDMEIPVNCMRNDYSNIFRSNWVLPRWLNILDEYVDIYKIAGRASGSEYIFDTLKVYIEGSEVDNLIDLLIGGTSLYLPNKIKINTKDIPDKLLTCECKECNKTCFICNNLIKLV